MKIVLTKQRMRISQALLLFSHMNKQYVESSKIGHKDICNIHCNLFLKYFFLI